jgi:hypothetical protein
VSSTLGKARNHKEPYQESKKLGEPAQCCDWPINPETGMMNELGRCHYAAASCVRSTAPVSCTELHYEDDGGLLGSTSYCQFGLVVRTHDAQHTVSRKKKQHHPHIAPKLPCFFGASG